MVGLLHATLLTASEMPFDDFSVFLLARSGLKHCFNDGHFERVSAANTSVAELRIHVGDVAPRLAVSVDGTKNSNDRMLNERLAGDCEIV